jgi:hypothetical protein
MSSRLVSILAEEAKKSFWGGLGRKVVETAVITSVEWSIRNGLDIWRRKKLKADFREMDQRFKAEDAAAKKAKAPGDDEGDEDGAQVDYDEPGPEAGNDVVEPPAPDKT